MAALLLVAIALGLRAAAPPLEPLEHLWDALATNDPARAEQVMARLVARPAPTVSFLRKRLRPVTVDARQVARWLADLDSDRYATRERATCELEKLSEAVEPPLIKALSGQPSLEARRRIERLLKQVRGERLSPSPRRRRAVSAIEVLERIGTTEARQVLSALARGAPAAALTVDAKGALERLAAQKDAGLRQQIEKKARRIGAEK
jgi:hypothetical protein